MLATHRHLALLLSFLTAGALGATGCSKSAGPAEPTMTYKYDPLASTTAEKPAQPKIEEKISRRKPSSTAPGGKTYVVQLGAFAKKENAEKLFGQLQAKNYPVILKTLDHKDFGQMYLVRLKPFGDRAEADRMATELADAEKLKPSVFVPKYR